MLTMDEIFGIPISGILAALVIALGLCLLLVAWVAWRRPVIFKLGMRNIPRRKAQTVLIVVGLMLSTLIISAALGTGDTLDYSLTKDIYQNYGNVDTLVVQSQQVDAPYIDRTTKIDASALALVETALAGNPDVDGIMPLLDEHVPVQNLTKQQAEPNVVLIGVDPARLDHFGGLRSPEGHAIDLGAIPANGVVLSEKAADELDATVGDTVAISYENAPYELTVAGIAEDTYLSGYRRGREDYLEYPGLVMPLTALQELTGQTDKLSAIAVSGAGGVLDGYTHSDAIKESLRPSLTGTGLGVDVVKSKAVADGERIASAFTSIFLILGLFSIMAGILLIVLIFTMLAAERRSEMGMARAVGTQRRQLIQQFVAEGAGYALLAGIVGSGLGVAASVGIANAMKLLFGQYVPISPHVEPRSMVVAYCLGVFITFLTVIGSSWKISRLNVVAAIRDIPEAGRGKRRIRSLLFGVLLLAGGAFLTLAGLGNDQAILFFSGASLAPFGLAMILRFFRVPSRPVFSLVGLEILTVWLLPESVGEKIWGNLDRGIELFFLSGVFMVVGATILIMQNTDVLLAAVGTLGGVFQSKLPAVRTAVAYPGAARGRTGLAIAMFSLIIFSLVMMATMSKNYDALYSGEDANAGWDVRADATGANPPADFTSALQAKGVDTSDFAATGITTNPSQFSSELRLAGTDEWKKWPVKGMDADFVASTTFRFSQRAEGYATDADIVAALRHDPNAAVIDAQAVSQGGDIGNDDSAFSLTGLKTGDKVFAPVKVELAGADGAGHTVTIIGVIDQKVGSLNGLFTSQATIAAVYPHLASTSYYVALTDEVRADAVAKEIEAALLQNGVQGIAIRDELRDQQKQETGFLYLIEGFMGLGLVVGIAAVGVIAFRSVVERRQQIGVLRALGFSRGLVSLSFLIETAFVVGMGIVAGTVLGIVLAYNLFVSDDGAGSNAAFMVPWPVISVILVATMAMALLMSWLPSRQAARIAPAEALRYE
jgi:putative ABC transport system permease protein